ncbi:hypothetical protein [Rhizobium leguminosarum]|uniref:hypothetical protein n=1 Tax=Rhizobium leguminosarum TaxID=384 RepID=UPI00140F5F46|nr:hypothetical protein [Rhizobium leguminosarum]QIO57322.1 hypothetical protein HA463_06220 [Rhizobium leguminosarum bv. trifolii]
MSTQRFVVKHAPEDDIGKDRIRIHYRRRLQAKRFSIMRVKSSKHSAVLCVLGLEGLEEDVQMDVDLRNAFGVQPNDKIDLEISTVGWIDKVKWYLFATDPAVHVPAWIGAWSFVLGLVGLFLSAAPLLFGK